MPKSAFGRLLVLFLVCLPILLSAGTTTMINGTWVGNMSVSVVSAEINGKSEIICLPRLEFKEVVDRQDLAQRMREGIKRQEAIFHLYHDGIGTPLRKNNMLFSADVFLKDAKATYIGLLREWGYSFKVIRKPAMDDSDYLQMIAAEGMIGVLQYPVKPKADKPLTGSGDQSARPEPTASAGGGNNTLPQGPLPDELMDIKEKYEVMPAGILHPSVRKAKRELEAKIRELKNRPYQAEIPRVDPVRWASGKMGMIEKDGVVSHALIEGQKLSLQALVPAGDWWKPGLRNKLASQSCEFILQRDRHGHEARRQQRPILADIYFSDLGQNWEEWLTEQGIQTATFTHQAEWATGTVELKVQVVTGVWDGLVAPSIARVVFPSPPPGINSNELVRLPPNEFSIKDYGAFCAAVNRTMRGKPVGVSLLFCLDGRPYDELGQKRALRVYLPETKDTLQLLMKRLSNVKASPRKDADPKKATDGGSSLNPGGSSDR